MKTPKRRYDTMKIVAGEVPWGQISLARWKRKNRVRQLKRKIARLTDDLTAERRQLNSLWLGDHLKRFSPEWDAFIKLRGLKTPAEDATLDEKFEYWVDLREVGKSVLNAACLAAMAYSKTKGENPPVLFTASNDEQEMTFDFLMMPVLPPREAGYLGANVKIN